MDIGRGEDRWVVDDQRFEFDESFQRLNPINGKLTGAAAKAEMIKSRLPNVVLGACDCHLFRCLLAAPLLKPNKTTVAAF